MQVSSVLLINWKIAYLSVQCLIHPQRKDNITTEARHDLPRTSQPSKTRKNDLHFQMSDLSLNVQQIFRRRRICLRHTSTWSMTVDVMKPKAYSPIRGWRMMATSLNAVVFWSTQKVIALHQFKENLTSFIIIIQWTEYQNL